ncbi:uncharacterized protein LOC117981721 isoform X2 [Pan paniscus]|uniref:uncharacterized protein LOC117981721 isoform X2 n=1 Tax=Pan paniscus TaxID=9597 RepID=UPI0024364AEC|nr:uncharacterized protein LOC117981721 isoform X2 [Pan paniscus]
MATETDSSVVRVVGAGHQGELLHAWLLGARACGPLACLMVVGGGGDRDCSMTRVAFLALPAQLLRARRRRRHLEPAAPRLASLRVGGSDGDCSVPERCCHLYDLSILKISFRPIWWFMLVIPAVEEAEMRVFLEPRSSKATWAT